MPLIKIPKNYLVSQDKDSIIVDIPQSILLSYQKDYRKITQAQGILKHKEGAILSYLDNLREEWDNKPSA